MREIYRYIRLYQTLRRGTWWTFFRALQPFPTKIVQISWLKFEIIQSRVERYTFQIMGLLLDALTLKHHRLPLCRMILTSSKASPSVKPLYTELFGRPNPRKEGGEQATKTHPLSVFNRISTQIIDLGPNWTQLW